MSQQQRDHVKRYVSSFKRWKEKNLSDYHCHTVAATVARKEFPLSVDEQREVDLWLDEGIRRDIRGQRKATSLFDDLPTAW